VDEIHTITYAFFSQSNSENGIKIFDKVRNKTKLAPFMAHGVV